jgi:hypothetical protein
MERCGYITLKASERMTAELRNATLALLELTDEEN